MYHRSRHKNRYVVAINYDTHDPFDRGVEITRINEDSEDYRKLTHIKTETKDGTLKILYDIDLRYNILSLENNTQDMQFILNYAEYTTLLCNVIGIGGDLKDSYAFGNENKKLRSYVDAGYMPLIMLPTPEINSWAPLLKSKLDSMLLDTISVSSASFETGRKLVTNDFWVHRFDLQNWFTNHRDLLRNKMLADTAPEKFKLVDILKEVYNI